MLVIELRVCGYGTSMDQYTCNFVCTYMQIDDDDLYRIQLLQALNIQVTDALATSVDANYSKTLESILSQL